MPVNGGHTMPVICKQFFAFLFFQVSETPEFIHIPIKVHDKMNIFKIHKLPGRESCLLCTFGQLLIFPMYSQHCSMIRSSTNSNATNVTALTKIVCLFDFFTMLFTTNH